MLGVCHAACAQGNKNQIPVRYGTGCARRRTKESQYWATLIPMKVKKQHLLQRSADLVGRKQLAQRLGIAEELLESWIRGDATMPDGQLLRLSEALISLTE